MQEKIKFTIVSISIKTNMVLDMKIASKGIEYPCNK